VYNPPADRAKTGLYCVTATEQHLLAGDNQGGVCVWNLQTGEARYIQTQSRVQILTILVMDGSRAVFAPNENNLLVYNYLTGNFFSYLVACNVTLVAETLQAISCVNSQATRRWSRMERWPASIIMSSSAVPLTASPCS
jgi:hypothetical protein